MNHYFVKEPGKEIKKYGKNKRKLPRNILGDSDDEDRLVGNVEPSSKQCGLKQVGLIAY